MLLSFNVVRVYVSVKSLFVIAICKLIPMADIFVDSKRSFILNEA